MIIGLSGKAGVGKTEFANLAAKEFGFTKLSFAAPLKAEVSEFLRRHKIKFRPKNLYGSQKDKEEQFELKHCLLDPRIEEDYYFLILKARFKPLDPTYSFRELLQWWGTEFRRAVCGTDYWVEKALAQVHEGGKYVFDDVRFTNEADAVRQVGGTIIRIERPNRPQVSGGDHSSETIMDEYKDFNHFVLNSSTLERYHNQIRKGLEKLCS